MPLTEQQQCSSWSGVAVLSSSSAATATQHSSSSCREGAAAYLALVYRWVDRWVVLAAECPVAQLLSG